MRLSATKIQTTRRLGLCQTVAHEPSVALVEPTEVVENHLGQREVN